MSRPLELDPAGAADLIVVGAAAGGVRALRALVAGLPPDLPAAVVVLLRSARERRSRLPDLLRRATRLPVDVASPGAPCRAGHISVVPSGARLVLDAGPSFEAARAPARAGPARPLDDLLRSASRHGPRVIGVLLGGARDHGVAGLQAIKARGGLVVVQDPRDADVPGMPCAALRGTDVDYVAPAAALGPLLARVARENAAALALEGRS